MNRSVLRSRNRLSRFRRRPWRGHPYQRPCDRRAKIAKTRFCQPAGCARVVGNPAASLGKKLHSSAARTLPRSSPSERKASVVGESEARASRQRWLADYLTRLDFVVLDEFAYLPFAQTGGRMGCRGRISASAWALRSDFLFTSSFTAGEPSGRRGLRT
jgi:hypothetical protein